MQTFYLGIDVSKGYADFIILNSQKQVVVENFQLDDTFDGHCLLFELLSRFFAIIRSPLSTRRSRAQADTRTTGIMLCWLSKGR